MPDGSSGQAIHWKLLLHVANHRAHTRAQITAAIRCAGHAPSVLEMLWFVLSDPG